MTDLASLGLVIDTTQVVQGAKALDNFTAAAKGAESSAAGVTTATQKSGAAFKAASNPMDEFAAHFVKADAASANYSKATNKVIDALANQNVRLNATGKQWAQLNEIQKAGVSIGSEAADAIAGMAGANYDLAHASEHAGESLIEQRTKFKSLAEAANLAGWPCWPSTESGWMTRRR